MAFRRLTRKLFNRINSEMRTCGKRKKERATIAAVIEHGVTGKYLIVYGKKTILSNEDNPGLVKGGMHPGEKTALQVLLREIEEELEITSSRIKVKGYGGSHRVKSLKRKGGFWRKRYFVFHTVYSGELEITIDTDELSGYRWIVYEEVEQTLSVLQDTRPEKLRVLLKVFRNLRSKKKKKTRIKPLPGR